MNAKLATIGLLTLLCALAGCSGADDPTAPAGGDSQPEPTHYEMSVRMSSINAVADCETAPGNPGDFRYTLKVLKQSGTDWITVATVGPENLTAGDGDIIGANMDPIVFEMPNEPGARFQVEYWVGEYDPEADFEIHGWHHHVLDRDEDMLWRAGSDYDAYNDSDPEEGYGVLKFAVWNERDNCKGSARYYVSWRPVYAAGAAWR